MLGANGFFFVVSGFSRTVRLTEMIDTYIADGPEPTWVLIVSLLAKYVAGWRGAKLSPLRAAAATCVITVASTLVGVAAELC